MSTSSLSTLIEHAHRVAQRPVFMVGSERSGTTMLRLLLDSHPDIRFGEEFEFALERVGADGTRPTLADYRRFLAGNRIFSTSGFAIDDRCESYDELVRGFLRSRITDEAVVGATVHFAFDRAPHIWPDARFIHIVRDPRDVGPSCEQMGWAGNAWFGLDKWLEAEQDWDTFRATIDDERCCEVRFEDLVTDPEAELTRICTFLGVEFTDEVFSYADDTDYGRPTADAAARWRRSQSAENVQLMEARLGDWLERRGYARSDFEPIDPAALDLAALRRADRLGRIRFRVERFGLALTLAEMATRTGPGSALRGPVQRRWNHIEIGHLRKSWR